MSTLHIVRHGQASFMSDDYDQLSPLGMRQSRLLGDYCTRHKLQFDRAIAGPKRRHAQTAAEVVAAYADAALPFPELEIHPAFDEFQADELVAHSVSELSAQYEHLKRLHDAYKASVERHDLSRNFQKFMEAVTLLWAKGDFESPNVEPWAGFRARVRAGLDRIREESASGSRVVVFTSGGPAAVAVQYATEMSAEKTLELIWTLRNAALVEFLYTSNRFTLSTFNSTPHLIGEDLATYR